MATAAEIGYGSVLTFNAVPVPEMVSVSHGGVTLNAVEATNMDSADTYAEFIAGIRDGGEVSGQANYTAAAGQVALKTALDAGTRVTGNTLALGATPKATVTFAGYVTAWSVDGDHAGKLMLNFSIKVDGKPTYA